MDAAGNRTSPSASAAAVTRLVASASGSSPPRALTMSKATIAPGPRIAAIATVSLRCAKRARSPLILLAKRVGAFDQLSSAITSSTASAAAQAIGLPA